MLPIDYLICTTGPLREGFTTGQCLLCEKEIVFREAEMFEARLGRICTYCAAGLMMDEGPGHA